MGKVKSAICLVLVSLLIAALGFACFVPFNFGYDQMKRYDPVITWTDKDADLGMSFGASDDEMYKNYLGGGYAAVYYPEGVISVREYEDVLASMPVDTQEERDAKTEYEEKYVRYPDEKGVLCLDREELLDGDEVTESFKSQFNAAAELLRMRYEGLHNEDVRVDIADGYTVRVFVPSSLTASFEPFAYTGAVEVKFGTEQDGSDAETVMPRRPTESINDYVKKFSAGTAANGSVFIAVDLTDLGKEVLKKQSASAAESGSTRYMFFNVGENIVLPLTVTEEMDLSTLTITSSDFTYETANIRALTLDTALNGKLDTELKLNLDERVNYRALYGENALPALYIAFGVWFAAMMIFFFIRYRRLAFAHLYTYLLFLLATVLCVWAIPFLYWSVETFVAFMISSVVLCVADAVTFEYARKEYAVGKTISSSVKTGYKRCFWHLFDWHIVLAAIGFLIYFIALPALSTFAFTLALTAVFSGIFCLAVNRFHWAIMMAFTKNYGSFCHFKRNTVEADDE